MLLPGESPHGGLRTNSIPYHGNLNRFREKIIRGTRNTVPARQEKSRTNRHKTPTGQATEKTTPEAVRSGQANGSNASETVGIATPDRTEQSTCTITRVINRPFWCWRKQKLATRTTCFSFWERTRCCQITQSPTNTESSEVSRLVFGESNLRFETRSALVNSINEVLRRLTNPRTAAISIAQRPTIRDASVTIGRLIAIGDHLMAMLAD